jgi:hypothetical protein
VGTRLDGYVHRNKILLAGSARTRPKFWQVSGMQAGGIALKAPSFTVRINLCQNQGDTGLKTSAGGTSNITKHDELRSR